MSLNKVQLIGLVGKDPEVREANGTKVASFTLATSERYKDRNGEYQTTTEWHNLVCWRQADYVEKYITKGALIYVEGKLRTRSWDDQNGNKRYVTEILVNELQSLERRKEQQSSQPETNQQAYGNRVAATAMSVDDDLPEGDGLPF